MTAHHNCPNCGRPMPVTRLGVRLPPMKVRLFDAIKRAGAAGITGPELVEALRLPIRLTTLKAHVWQINEALDGTGYKIVGYGGYRLVRWPTPVKNLWITSGKLGAVESP